MGRGGKIFSQITQDALNLMNSPNDVTKYQQSADQSKIKAKTIIIFILLFTAVSF